MNKRNLVGQAIRCVLVAGAAVVAAGYASTASAANANIPANSDKLTGRRIKHTSVETTRKITRISRQQIQQSGNTQKTHKNHWVQLFNGKNLHGWIPKFSGYKLGINYKNTFRVEKGLLTVAYDKYDQFRERYGHLFYKAPFSNYKIKIVYRFFGKQVAGGKKWAYRNNGLMLHCQKPDSMGLDQNYPVSIEVQLLGANAKQHRSTANVCTTGTHVMVNGHLNQQHCVESTSESYPGNQWVTVEAVVHGSGIMKNSVNGKTVLTYSKPQYNKSDPAGRKLSEKYGHTLIDHGYIAIQAESAPTQFKKIEIMPIGN